MSLIVSPKASRAIAHWRRQRVKLLVFAGRGKSGKDICVAYLKRRFGPLGHLRIASAPVAIARILGIPPERRVQQALFGVNALLYPILGESAYKRRVARILDREKPKIAIVEAIRTKEEYDEFVRKRKGILIGVSSSPTVRYQRARSDAKRSEKRDEARMSLREFLARDKTPMERDIDWVVSHAHFVIENNYTGTAPLYLALDRVAAKLGIRKR